MKNLNEEINRMKSLMTEERLYGNLVESAGSNIKNFINSLDEFADNLHSGKHIDDAKHADIKAAINKGKKDLSFKYKTKFKRTIKQGYIQSGYRKMINYLDNKGLVKDVENIMNNAFEGVDLSKIEFKGKSGVDVQSKKITDLSGDPLVYKKGSEKGRTALDEFNDIKTETLGNYEKVSGFISKRMKEGMSDMRWEGLDENYKKFTDFIDNTPLSKKIDEVMEAGFRSIWEAVGAGNKLKASINKLKSITTKSGKLAFHYCRKGKTGKWGYKCGIMLYYYYYMFGRFYCAVKMSNSGSLQLSGSVGKASEKIGAEIWKESIFLDPNEIVIYEQDSVTPGFEGTGLIHDITGGIENLFIQIFEGDWKQLAGAFKCVDLEKETWLVVSGKDELKQKLADEGITEESIKKGGGKYIDQTKSIMSEFDGNVKEFSGNYNNLSPEEQERVEKEFSMEAFGDTYEE